MNHIYHYVYILLYSANRYQDHARRFEAPILVNVLISHFYGIKKPDPIDRKLDRPEQLKLGWRVPQFVQQINGPFLSLLSAGIFHSLLNWSKGTFQPEKFKGRSEASKYLFFPPPLMLQILNLRYRNIRGPPQCLEDAITGEPRESH